MSDSQTTKRSCPTCHKSEPEVQFYRVAEDCRSCINSRSVLLSVTVPLADKVERHRQAKILREELKKLAKKRIERRKYERKSAEKKKAVDALMPKTQEPAVAVDAATKELALRVLQRRRLIEFVQAFHPKYKAGWVHVDICRKLEQFSRDVAAGKSPRLMILMPPRHGKSQIASKLYPAWHIGHYPDHEIIACSYNIALARDFSTDVREVVRSERYAALFPKAKLDPKDQGVEAWKLLPNEGIIAGGYVAAGIGGPINGKGAHVLIIDDPIKNEEEASSSEHLKKTNRWFDSTAYTRLAPGGGVLVVQTWWSDMDLAGYLQEQMAEEKDEDGMTADQYDVIKYPAIATEDETFRVKGDPLHPERYPLEALLRIKKKLGGDTGRFWNALYQQNPVPDEGAMFTKDMFVWREERPDLSQCYVYQAWDYAIGEKRTNDYTVGVTVAVDYDDNAHVLEVVRFRSSDQLRIANEMLDMYDRFHNVLAVGVEDGQIWRGVRTHLNKRMGERRLYPSIEELTPLTDKLVRAQTLQGRMKQRKVTFPKSGGWVGDLHKEFLRFPAGMHDDQVDALAWCARIFSARTPPRRPKVAERPKERTVAERLRDLARGAGSKSSHMAA